MNTHAIGILLYAIVFAIDVIVLISAVIDYRKNLRGKQFAPYRLWFIAGIIMMSASLLGIVLAPFLS